MRPLLFALCLVHGSAAMEAGMQQFVQQQQQQPQAEMLQRVLDVHSALMSQSAGV